MEKFCGYGVMMHPSAIAHEKAARKLVSHIRGLDKGLKGQKKIRR
jgi:hypothetical protein